MRRMWEVISLKVRDSKAYACQARKNSFKYKCDTCQKEFAEKRQLRAHMVTHGGSAINCRICDRKYTTEFALKRHMASAHEQAIYTCPVCQRTFGDKDVLKDHTKALHRQHG